MCLQCASVRDSKHAHISGLNARVTGHSVGSVYTATSALQPIVTWPQSLYTTRSRAVGARASFAGPHARHMCARYAGGRASRTY